MHDYHLHLLLNLLNQDHLIKYSFIRVPPTFFKMIQKPFRPLYPTSTQKFFQVINHHLHHHQMEVAFMLPLKVNFSYLLHLYLCFLIFTCCQEFQFILYLFVCLMNYRFLELYCRQINQMRIIVNVSRQPFVGVLVSSINLVACIWNRALGSA